MADDAGSDPLKLDYQPPSPRRRRWRWLWFLLLIPAGPMIGTLFLPSLNSPHPTSNRVKCASNLRQIGQAILLYSQDHGGQYPDSLPTILVNEDITSDVFVCPSSDDTPATGPTTQAIAAALLTGGHCSYIYLGKGFNTATVPPNAVVACEPLTNHAGEGSNVLFGDGHVEFMNASWMAALSAKAARPHPATAPVTMPTG